MTTEKQTQAWQQYFSTHPAQSFMTIRLPRCKTKNQAYTACRNILLDLSRTLSTEISAVGVFIGSNTASERHCHLIIDSDRAALRELTNAHDHHGSRPALPLSRKHRHLDHLNAIDLQPIKDRVAVDCYMAQNFVNSRHPATDVIVFNQKRLLQLKAA